jgi:pilus assembly protein CpaE
MLERFMVRDGAVRVLSTPGSLRETRFLDADAVEHVVSMARTMAKVVVVDFPKGWGAAYERLAAQADEVVLVASPDLAALRNCRMIVEDVAGRRIDGRRPKLVLNRMGMSKRNEYGAADFTEAGGGAPSALVPWEPDPLLAAVADGKPLIGAGGKAVAALKAFAATLLLQEGAKAPAKGRKGGQSLLAQLRAKINGLVPSKGKA